MESLSNPFHRPQDADQRTTSRVPERRSSKARLKNKSSPSLYSPSDRDAVPVPSCDLSMLDELIRPRGRSSSPLRRPESRLRNHTCRTHVPNVVPVDLLYAPKLTHPRIRLDLCPSSPVFVGGATVEGDVHLVIDGGVNGRKRKSSLSVSIGRISVAVVGIESCKGRQEIFRALVTDVVDASHPLPSNMAPKLSSGNAWSVAPSSSILPFRLDLPVCMGPPPYESKKAGIRYLVSATIEAGIAGKRFIVRQSREIAVLSVHDPEKALVSLSYPLFVSDELQFSSHGPSAQKIVLCAGIHRQSWISGYPMFVDVKVENQSNKFVRKIELQLERVTTFHNHPAPSTNQGTIDLLRVPDHIHKETVLKIDVSEGLRGLIPVAQELRTCQLEIPSGLVSVAMGRFFGVRFFLNVILHCSFLKQLKVQLPITIIHPNSIDIPTNALAQVAASIEHRHRHFESPSGTGSPYHYRPGQAFLAARRQSHLQLRQETLQPKEIESLTRTLDDSPRRRQFRLQSQIKRPLRPSSRRNGPLEELDQNLNHRTITHRKSEAAISQALSDKKHFDFPSPKQTERLKRRTPSYDNGIRPDVLAKQGSGSPLRAPYMPPSTPKFVFPPPQSPFPAAVRGQSMETITRPRVSFDAPSNAPPSTPAPGPPLYRSDLEKNVRRGLRGISIDTNLNLSSIYPPSSPVNANSHATGDARCKNEEQQVESLSRYRRVTHLTQDGDQSNVNREITEGLVRTNDKDFNNQGRLTTSEGEPGKLIVRAGWKGPRLMRSTSGLEFDEGASDSIEFYDDEAQKVEMSSDGIRKSKEGEGKDDSGSASGKEKDVREWTVNGSSVVV